MRRPGPLKDLPLERFTPSNPNLPFPKSVKSNKRALSPGGPNLYSPAKRRILNDEGIFSPEMTCKSPLSASRGGFASPARFSDVLAGPSSPAKKLDFGSPKNQVEPNYTPRARQTSMDSSPSRFSPSARSLAPSPELKPKAGTPQFSSPSIFDEPEMDDYFGSPTSLPLLTRLTPKVATIPRDPPLASDPQSLHYPGFRVFQDPHIVISPVAIDFPSADVDKDTVKENVPPRRKPKKMATAPNAIDLKSQLLSPESIKRERLHKAASTPVSFKSIFGVDPDATPTPRLVLEGSSQRLLRSNTKLAEERKDMRRLLEVEVDDTGGDEDYYASALR